MSKFESSRSVIENKSITGLDKFHSLGRDSLLGCLVCLAAIGEVEFENHPVSWNRPTVNATNLPGILKAVKVAANSHLVDTKYFRKFSD